MTKHKSMAGVQEHGCGALLNIGWSNTDLQNQIKWAGAEALVRSAMAASNATSNTKQWRQQLLDRLVMV